MSKGFIKLSILAGIVLVAITGLVFTTKALANGNNLPDYICHATPPDTAAEGYVQNFPANAGQLAGHVTQHNADIIPPFSFDPPGPAPEINYPGKNWDAEGQAIYRNGCEVPEEEPVDVCDNIEGIQEKTPDGYINDDGNCYLDESPVDVCENLEGIQEETPEGYINEQGNCYIPEGEDVCPNLEGIQEKLPDGYHFEEYGDNHEYEQPICVPNEPENPPVVTTSDPGGNVTTPTCPNGNTAKVPAWPHVDRTGDHAIVNAFITEGDNAHIYWKVVGEANWQHSSAGTNPDGVKPNADKYISYDVGGLDPNLGYTFGISQQSGCGGGEIVTAVIVDGPATQRFSISYYELR